MSRESNFAVRMRADATLPTFLTGGVYTREDVGPKGISRETTPGAFDAGGYLKPCSLVNQRGRIPDAEIFDEAEQTVSAWQVVEIWLYADSSDGWTPLDSAMSRLYALFQGHPFSGANACAPIQWAFTLDRARDPGALKGSLMARMDFRVVALRRAA